MWRYLMSDMYYYKQQKMFYRSVLWFLGGYLLFTVLKKLIGKEKEMIEEAKSPLDMLQERYALGQIDESEYQRMKTDLQ